MKVLQFEGGLAAIQRRNVKQNGGRWLTLPEKQTLLLRAEQVHNLIAL